MKLRALPHLAFMSSILALGAAQVRAPALAGKGAPVSASDRIYTGDQTSSTISVIDPSQNKVLGTINLGDPRLTDDLNPQYVRSVSSHGLGFSRDGKYIVSLSVLSNTVTVICTSDNSIVSQTFVDRGPHEAFFNPDNRTVWIGTRGVSSVNVVDGIKGSFIGRIKTADGPSKVLFSPDGTNAYVNHIRAPVVSVIDVASKSVKYNITGLADTFSSDMMLSADGGSLWVAHKMTGQVSVLDLHARRVISILETGPETNHPNFAVVNGTTYAFVTVAALNQTKVYLQATPQTEPIYIGAIQAATSSLMGSGPVQTTRGWAVSDESLSTQNLGTQGLNLQTANKLVPVESDQVVGNSTPQALITVRQTDGLDMFQIIGRNLQLNGSYTASAVCSVCGGDTRIPLVSFKASTPTKTGCGTAPQVLAFFKWFGVYDIDSLRIAED